MQFASSHSGFIQDPPTLANQYANDAVLQAILRLYVPPEKLALVEPDLARFGGVVVSDQMLDWVQNAEDNPPTVSQFDAWGRRVDRLVTSEGWRAMRTVSAREGIIAAAYDERGRLAHNARVVQFAKYYLFSPSSALYTCPLAMTDGGARLVELSGDAHLMNHVFPRLTSRDPHTFWTSGQWMSERPGGSDVGPTETVACPPSSSSPSSSSPSSSSSSSLSSEEDDLWSIHGFKFFSSGTDSDATFLLARHGTRGKNGDVQVKPGSKGLSLFHATLRTPTGASNGVRIHRLKDKLGTKPVPTAELELVGMKARLVGKPYEGVRTIATILNVTRIHCAVSSVSFLRRALATARDYAHRRVAFGKPIAAHPLHARLLAEAETHLRANMELVFYVVHLLGITEVHERQSAGVLPPDPLQPLPPATSYATDLLRLLTPCTKTFAATDCVHQIGLCMEALGGQGYMEDAAGIPRLWRDAQVQAIWEGTGAVMAHDVARVIRDDRVGPRAWKAYGERVREFADVGTSNAPRLAAAGKVLITSLGLMDRHVAAIRATAPSGTSASIRETVDRAVEGTWKALTWSIAEVIAGALLVRHAMVLLSSAPDALETQQHVAAAVRWCTDPTTYPGHKEVACAHIVDAVLSGSAFKEGGVESGSDDLLAFGVAKVDTQSGKMKL